MQDELIKMMQEKVSKFCEARSGTQVPDIKASNHIECQGYI